MRKWRPSSSRRFARVKRCAVVVAAAVVAPLVVVAPAVAEAPLPVLYVSTSWDRSSPVPLEGSTLTGPVAIFLDKLPEAAAYTKVTFYLDDPARTGSPYSVDPAYPFDFNGTEPCSAVGCVIGPAWPLYETLQLRQGTHRVTAVADVAGGATSLVTTSTFVVRHPATEPPRIHPDAVQPGVRTNVADAARFLYTGEFPPQEGVAESTIERSRAAIVRGRVTKRDGAPLPNVSVTVSGHPEYGSTRTRSDGWFDLAVNGGEDLVVALARDGYVPVHRRVSPVWQDWAVADATVLSPYDASATAVQPQDVPSGTFVTARGSTVVDSDGTRRSTLLVPGGVVAEMVLPDGSRRPLNTLTLRQTEFTVGATGEAAMPAPLPETSAYTYAVDLSVDEARAAGATGVEFSEPLWLYNENFLQFPAGTTVPAGRYDYERRAWVRERSGVVLEIVSEGAGRAEVDANGDGSADTPAELAAIGLGDAELLKLAELYAPGDSLWRVPVTHFSPWDLNWGWGLAGDAFGPMMRWGREFLEKAFPNCFSPGSVIGCESQTLGEKVDLVGTNASLAYSTARVPGYRGNSALSFLVTPDRVPETLARVEVVLQVAGRTFHRTLDAVPNARLSFDWDGVDAYGRRLNGAQNLTINVRYVYRAVRYTTTSSFGSAGGSRIDGSLARLELYLDRTFTTEVSPGVVADSRDLGLGGWTLSMHHSYDPESRLLARGDGRVEKIDPYGSTITTLAGAGPPGATGDGGAARDATLHFPGGAAYDGAGNLYIADTFNDRIRKVTPTGTITTVAGTGAFGYSGDGGAATAATLASPLELATAADGALYVADVDNHRVRRIAKDGTIATVAGTGVRGFAGDDGPATDARLAEPTGIVVARDGSLYVADRANHRVRRVDPGGTITTVAGTGSSGFSGDGGAATAATLNAPTSVTTDRDGNVYVADTGNRRVRQISPTGVITTVAGNGAAGTTGDGLAATSAQLTKPTGVAVDGDGNLYVADMDAHRVRRVSTDGVIVTVAGTGTAGSSGTDALSQNARLAKPRAVTIGPDGTLTVVDARNNQVRRIGPTRPAGGAGSVLIPATGGDVVYAFDASGRHLRTVDALTGVEVYRFGYDGAGRLTSVTDRDDNVISITRPSAATVRVASPHGLTTTLTLDSAGWTRTITTPGGRANAVTYDGGGLLKTFGDRNGATSSYDYDDLGRLTAATGRDAKTTTLTRTELEDGLVVTVRTPMGREKVHRLTHDANDAALRTVSDSMGTQSAERRARDGVTVVTVGGNTLTHTYAPDPRWGMTRPQVVRSTVQVAGRSPVTATVSRSLTLSDALDPFAVATSSEVSTVGSRTWSTVYSKAAGTVTTTSPEGRARVTTLDAKSRVVAKRDGDLLPVAFAYDSRGRVNRVTRGDGAAARETVVTYRPDGFVDTVTDPLGRVTTSTPDADGRVTQASGPSGTATAAYDANDNPTSVAPPGRPAYGLTPAVDDRLARYRLPDADQHSDNYDYPLNDDRQYTGATLPSGTTASFDYDTAGRLASVSRGSAVVTLDWTGGRFTGMTSPHGVTSAAVYQSGIRTGTTWSGAVSGSYTATYDDEMRLASDTAGGAAAAYGRDGDGLLTQAGPLTITRDPETGITTATRAGQVRTTLDHSGFGDLDRLRATYATTTTLYDVDFRAPGSRDKLGRTATRKETVGGQAVTAAYEYHPSGRLKRTVVDGAEAASYEYDGAGNLTTETRPTGAVTSTYDVQDRILTRGPLSYTHDADGQRTAVTDTATAATTTYRWTMGRLAGATLADGTTVDYLADGEGRRVGKKLNGALVRSWVWSGRRLVAETDVAAAVTSRFVYGARSHVPDVMIRSGTTYRLVTDERGSVRLVVDTATGAVAQRLDYDDWGRVSADTNPGFQPFGYAGGLTDAHTGLVRFGSRDYDPVSTRWLSRDTIGFAGGANHYAYADGDPVNRIDPTGQSALGCISDVLSAAGMIPGPVGMAFDAANVAVLLADGRVGDAGFAFAAIALPGRANQMRGGARFGDDAAGAGSSFAGKTCNCFPAGTTVATAGGAKPIEKIRVGDRVHARDLTTGKTRLRRVVDLFRKQAEALIDLDVAGTTVSVTPEHPFYVPGRGWVPAGLLQTGDRLLERDGTTARIGTIAVRRGRVAVYNFEVEGDHNYYVTRAQLLVHNADCEIHADLIADALGDGAKIRRARSPDPAYGIGDVNLPNRQKDKFWKYHDYVVDEGGLAWDADIPGMPIAEYEALFEGWVVHGPR